MRVTATEPKYGSSRTVPCKVFIKSYNSTPSREIHGRAVHSALLSQVLNLHTTSNYKLFFLSTPLSFPATDNCVTASHASGKRKILKRYVGCGTAPKQLQLFAQRPPAANLLTTFSTAELKGLEFGSAPKGLPLLSVPSSSPRSDIWPSKLREVTSVSKGNEKRCTLL